MLKSLYWIPVFIFFGLPTLAQNIHLDKIEPQILNKKFLEEFMYEENQGLMFLNVKINGEKQSFKFLVDTGAPTVISPQVAQLVKSKIGRNQMVGSGGSQKDSLQLGLLDTVRIGNLTFTQITCIIAPFNQGEIMKCLEIDGIIGANLMSTAIWQFDRQAKKITVTDQRKKFRNTKNTEVLPIRLFGWQRSPLLTVKVNRQITETILIDTGFGGFFTWSRTTFLRAKSRNMLDTTRICVGYGASVESIFGKDIDSATYRMNLHEIAYGKQIITNPVAEIDLDDGSKFGVDWFDLYLITIDFKNGKIALTPRENTNYEKNWETFGFSAYLQENDLRISYLVENSPATRAGLKLGDRVLEINGLSFRTIQPQNRCELFLKFFEIQKKEESIALTFAREGETQQINLNKEILLGER
jgi:predicted aspartyl protease